MKNFFLTFACLLFATFSTVSQTYVVSREQLRDAIDPLNLRSSQLMTLATNGIILSYKAETGTNATDSVLSFNSTKRANYKWTVVNWDGDVRAFGSFNSSLSDVGDTINRANTNAVALGIPLLLPEGSFKVSTWINLISGSHIKGKGMGKTRLLRNSSSSAQTNDLRYATLQTPGVFNPYLTNGGHIGTVSCTVSNIVLADFSLGVADTSFPGFGIALFASDSAFVRGVEVTTHSNHWAIAVLGNRTVFDQIKIRNTGYIYRDGIHFLGGRGLTISSSDIDTGDDCVAISSASALDVEVADVVVTGNHLVSSHAHAIRVNQENPSATNIFRGIVFDAAVGRGGIYRNGPIRITSASTNFSAAAGTFPIQDVTLAHCRFTMGTASEYEAGSTKLYGAYIQGVDRLLLNDVHVGATAYPSYYLFDSGKIEMVNCSGFGGTNVGFGNALHAANVAQLTVRGGQFRNDSGIATTPIALNGCGVVLIDDVLLTNSVAGRGVIQTLTAASRKITIKNSTLVAPDIAVLMATNSTYFTMVDNWVQSPNNVQFGATYTIPDNYTVYDNDGQSRIRRYLATREFHVPKANDDLGWNWFGQVNNFYGGWFNTNGVFVLYAGTNNLFNQPKRLGFGRYTNSLAPMAGLLSTDSGTFTTLGLNGGSSLVQPAQWLQTYISGTNNIAGLEVQRVDLPTVANRTPFQIPAYGIESVILTLTVTNFPSIGDGYSLMGSNRVAAAAESSTAFATNSTTAGTATSIRTQLLNYPIADITPTVSGTNVILTSRGGVPVSSVSVSGNWVSAVLTTNKLPLARMYVGSRGSGPTTNDYLLYLRWE